MSDMHPTLPNNQYVTEFTYAYELHVAASGTRLLRNREPEQPTKAARQQILDIATALMVKARDEALDKFCVSWLTYRNLPIPDATNAP